MVINQHIIILGQINDFVGNLFGTESWPARWKCGTWTEFHGWLYVCSDVAIWGAYFVIPFFILKFLKAKPNLPLPQVFWLFGAFILFCGLSHLMDAILFWWPGYRLSALIRFITAIVSWTTIIALYKYFPLALGLKTARDFEAELTERKKSESKFMGLLESAPDAMIITNGQGNIVMINAQTERIFGFKREEIIGKKVEYLVPERFHHKHTSHREGYVENPKVRGMGIGMNLSGKRKDGSEFPVEISLSPLKINEEEGLMVISAIRDVTKQKETEAEIKLLNENLEKLVVERTAELELALASEKAARAEMHQNQIQLSFLKSSLYKKMQDTNEELELRVAHRTSELQAINKELEAFSYSVSHDLRAPLRSIDGFSNKILKDYGSLFDEQGKDYFMRVMNASKNMGHLIDDLLKLARISRMEMNFEEIDLSALARSITDELMESDPERKAVIEIQQEMKARGDRNLIQIALQNMLDNAWKYSKHQPLTHIEFGIISGEQATYFIRDNGVGFDMKYVDKLFGAFQRLHSQSEFEGTGVGLATVQRIIRRHQGTIRAESEINKGTTFIFTI